MGLFPLLKQTPFQSERSLAFEVFVVAPHEKHIISHAIPMLNSFRSCMQNPEEYTGLVELLGEKLWEACKGRRLGEGASRVLTQTQLRHIFDATAFRRLQVVLGGLDEEWHPAAASRMGIPLRSLSRLLLSRWMGGEESASACVRRAGRLAPGQETALRSLPEQSHFLVFSGDVLLLSLLRPDLQLFVRDRRQLRGFPELATQTSLLAELPLAAGIWLTPADLTTALQAPLGCLLFSSQQLPSTPVNGRLAAGTSPGVYVVQST